MRATATTILAGIVTMGAAAGTAAAQSAPTCSFDAGTATVTVTVNGQIARVQAIAASGEIRLNGAACGGATVSNTDQILVNGSDLIADEVTLTGTFMPGLTPETDGASEIEISFAPGPNRLTVNGSEARDRVIFTASGIDVGEDLDTDIMSAGIDWVTVDGRGGNDRLDAAAYDCPGLSFSRPILIGGEGDDVLIASNDCFSQLYGDAGNDTLIGGDGGDHLYGGDGDDHVFGNGGNDRLAQERAADGADDLRGGDGVDSLWYDRRSNAVTVTIGDQLPDGEAGEGDLVRADVEDLRSGDGDDILVGTDAANLFNGGLGDDELYGAGGDDQLLGQSGNDIVVGDAGDDRLDGGPGADFVDGGHGDDTITGYQGPDELHGGGGRDVLDGGDGADVLRGGADNDRLIGGAGVDQFFGEGGNDRVLNADGLAEAIDCGSGALDDADPDPLDTLTGCEL